MSDAALQKLWYGRSPFAFLLLPFSFLFFVVTSARRALYSLGVLHAHRVSKPVIVVGNVTVGGTGKTPFVVWLARELRSRGYTPAVITRGYGGSSPAWPQDVNGGSDPAQVGDEAVLLALQTAEIVVAGPDRVASARRAIERGADLIISDDGLQHYRLARTIEIAVVDAERYFGNGWLLPAGPLRELPSRLDRVDGIVLNKRDGVRERVNGNVLSGPAVKVSMKTSLGSARSLLGHEQRSLDSFVGRAVHAVAAIGNPNAFFDSLRARGLTVDARALPDHAALKPDSLRFSDAADVLMTEKDAVKCRAFADHRCWAVELVTAFDAAPLLLESILGKLEERKRSAQI